MEGPAGGGAFFFAKIKVWLSNSDFGEESMRKLLSVVFASLFLLSCGGGGGGGATTAPGAGGGGGGGGTPGQPPSVYKLAGYSADDYVLNATVEVYDIDTGKLLARTGTSANGRFEVNVPTDARLLIRVSGGVLDPDGNPMTTIGQKPFDKVLLTFADLSLVQGGNSLFITPASTGVVASALGVDGGSLMDGQVDPVDLLSQISDKDKVFNAFKDGVDKLPNELKPFVSGDYDLSFKEQVVAGLVGVAGKPENLAKELEDLNLDGDFGLTEKTLLDVKMGILGGGGSSEGGGEGAPSQPPQPSTKQKSFTLRVTDDNGNPVPSANVVVRVLQPTRAARGLTEVGKKTSQSSNGGYASFTVDVPDGGGVLEVTVVKDGFTQSVKSLRFDSDGDIPDRLDIKASRVQHSQVVDSSTTSFSRSGRGKLVFYVVKDRTGKRSLRVGNPGLTRGGGSVTFKMEVPADLYQGATKIRADISNYDPSNKTDAGHMPSWEDANGNRLASVSFDYIKLTNLDTGEPLKRSLSRANEDPVVIVRQVRCSLLQGDSDPDTPGYQVPFYVLIDGVWNYLGEGVVVTDYNGDTVKDVNSVCQNTDYEYVKITITNPDFSNPYINLDYPLATNISNQKCALLRFVSSRNGQAISGLYVSLSDDDSVEDFYWSEGITGDDGRVKIATAYYGNTTDTTAMIGYWNDFTSQFVQQQVTLKDCDSQDYDNVTVNVPANLCYVQGRVVDENGNGTRAYVAAYATDWSYYKWSEADDQGLFNIQVICNTDSYLQVKDVQKSFNVNGTVNGDESSDTGSVATLNVVISNAAPYPGAWTDSTQFVSPSSIPVNVSVYDEEGDFPVTVRVMLLDQDGNVVESATESVDSTSFDPYSGWATVNVPAPGNGVYWIDVNATDSKGKSRDMGNEWGRDYLPRIQIVSAQNNPPILEYTYVWSYGKRIYTDISASDVDGDLSNCTVTVQAENGTSISPDVSDQYPEGSYCWGHFEFVANSAGNYTVTFTARDSQGNEASYNATVYSRGDIPPQLFMWIDKVYNLQAGDMVNVYVHVEDDDPVNATELTFSVNGTAVNTECDFENGEPSQTPCYFTDPWMPADATLIFVVPEDNATSYDICANGTINGVDVGRCETVYKGSVPANANLQVNIRK